jgi:hypothetical protein
MGVDIAFRSLKEPSPMPNLRSTQIRWLLGAVLIAAGGAQADAAIIFPPNQTPFTMPAGVSTTVEVCRFQHSTSKKKNDFDVTVDWGDATGLDGPFHPNKKGKTSYVIRRAHTYAACGVYSVTCNVDYKAGTETGSDTNVATVSGTAAAPVMTVSAVCPADGATGLTASVASGATNYVWSMLDGNGADITSLITAGQNTEQITFDAAPAGSLMFISLNETAGDNCPAATATRRAQVDYTDVSPTHPQHDAVCTLAGNQLTAGCGDGLYCPDLPTTREQVAYLGLAARHWADVPPYDPGVGTGAVFADVPASSDYVDWIEAVVVAPEQWMAACDATPNFCPLNSVTRAQLTRFLLKSKYGVAFDPPPPAVDPYTDVAAADFAAGFIDQLKTDFGLIPEPLGCEVGKFCPSSTATRAHLAHFMVHIFGVPSL